MIDKVLRNRWAELAGRWLLGITFVFASYHKIMSPAEFAKIVFGYGLFPGETVNLIAIILPFVELVAGIALIAGIWIRPAASIILCLLAAFIVVVSINLARGHVFDCGCFSTGSPLSPGTPLVTLLRNLVLMMLGYLVLRFPYDRRRVLARS